MESNNNNGQKFKEIFNKIYYYFDLIYYYLKSAFMVFLIIFLVGIALVGGTAVGFYASLVNDAENPSYEQLTAQVNDYNVTSSMYYASGEPISDLKSDLVRTPVSIDSVSPHLTKGIISIEDEYFLEHNGIVPKAIFRALAQQVLNTSEMSGGSSLTQQVVKQQILTNEVSFDRKATEILLALRLEDTMSKDEILEAYLNVSPFGRNNKGENIAGVYEAATGIFGVTPEELNLPQAAFISGLPPSPIDYSPYNQYGEIKDDLEAGKNRQITVLYNMLREGHITQAEYDQAVEYDLTADFLTQENSSQEGSRSYVYDLAEREARDIFFEHLVAESEYTLEEVNNDEALRSEYMGQADQEMRSGGYTIHTTVDQSAHSALNQVVEESGNYIGLPKTATVTGENGESQSVTYPAQTGATMIDNDTGRIIAFIGGRDYDYSEYNIPFDTRRSTGSAIKPLAVYGPALAEQVITPATIVPDTEYEVPSWENGELTGHSISNYGETTNEWKTAREWLVRSQNIPTSKIYMEMINNDINPAPYLRRMGIGQDAISDQEIQQPSTALGGYQGGPTITEVSAGYASIANNGQYNEPYIIDRIESAEGEVVFEHAQEPTQVWNEGANFLLLDMLRGVHEDGTAQGVMEALNFNTDLASKTGTSNAFRDLWYVGSTPTVTFGLWSGYDNQNISMEADHGTHPSSRNREMWTRYMNAVYSANSEIIGANQNFPDPPESVVQEEVLAGTGMKSGEVELPNDETTTVDGETTEEYFENSNVPETTAYDFALGATDEELEQFWSEYTNSSDSNNGDDENNDVTSSIRSFLDELFNNNDE